METTPTPDTPELRLCTAILDDAFQIVVRPHERALNQTLYRETLAWFASDERAHPFAFRNLCDLLHLRASVIRSGLSRRLPVATPAATGARLRAVRPNRPVVHHLASGRRAA